MYAVVLLLLVTVQLAVSSVSSDFTEHKKRALSSFDTLAGTGFGKRALVSSIDSLGGVGLGKRALSSFDTLGGIGLGKRSQTMDRRAVSSFDTLAGIGLGKRSKLYRNKKKSLSSFDTLAGTGLGKRAGILSTGKQVRRSCSRMSLVEHRTGIFSPNQHFFAPYRTYVGNKNRKDLQ